MGIHSSHRLGTVWISATCETCKKPIPLEFLCFLLILPYYGNSIFPCFWNLLQFPRFLFHTKYLKDPWFLNVCIFPYFSRTMRIRFSYVLGTVWIFASCKVWKKALDFRMFCFPILFSYYRNSFFPCFGDNTTDEKTNKILLFPIPFSLKHSCESFHEGSYSTLLLSPTQYLHFRSLCHRCMEISTVQKSRNCLLRQCFSCNISMNIIIRICLKIDPS